MHLNINTTHLKIIEKLLQNIKIETSEIQELQFQITKNEITNYVHELLKIQVWSDYIEVAKVNSSDTFSKLCYGFAYDAIKWKARKISSMLDLSFFSVYSFLTDYGASDKLRNIHNYVERSIKTYVPTVKNARMEFLYPDYCKLCKFWFE
jgi:hypothetical protein